MNVFALRAAELTEDRPELAGAVLSMPCFSPNPRYSAAIFSSAIQRFGARLLVALIASANSGPTLSRALIDDASIMNFGNGTLARLAASA
jgi:hypothetical protein